MKTTIIKILNQIANGEEVPKKIKYNGQIWEYKEKFRYWLEECSTYHEYINDDDDEDLFDVYFIAEILNDEVEILETTITYNLTGNKIEKIDVAWQNVFDEQAQQDFAKMTLNKINELIDRYNNEG